MRTGFSRIALGGAFCGLALLATFAFADPYPDQFAKFVQKPMVKLELGNPANPNDYAVYYGHDQLSTAYLELQSPIPVYQGTFMADDFADVYSTPVVHLQWWGSYMNAIGTVPRQVKQFLVCFERDIPAGQPGPDGIVVNFSRPGPVLLSQIVSLNVGTVPPPAGMFNESMIREPDPLLNEAVYEYNAELAIPFRQERDTVYWLKIVALVDPRENPDDPIRWGWHNRDYTIANPLASPKVIPGETVTWIPAPAGPAEMMPVWHFQDDAVRGPVTVELTAANDIVVHQPFEPEVYRETYYVPPYDGPEAIRQFSKDLAFVLYTIPEPATIWLLAIGMACLVARWGIRRI